MNGKRIPTLAAALLSLLLILYVGYQIYQGNHKAIIFETAAPGSVSDTIRTEGFAVRSESVVLSGAGGVLSYRVADGTRVASQGVIAEIYASEADAAAQNRVERLDREIAGLEALAKPSDFYAANAGAVNTQIYTAIDALLTQARTHNFPDVGVAKEELQTALNRKQLVTGEDTTEAYLRRIQELQQERDALSARSSSAIGTVTSPLAGYFISAVDGYEDAWDPQKITGITAAQAESLMASQPGAKPAAAVGKVCGDFNWYLVCVLSDDDMWRFEELEEVELDIPLASTETIPARIVAKNRDALSGKTAMVLECSYMDSDIASVRRESVQIRLRTYSGVLVNEKALRFCDVTAVEEDENGVEREVVHQNVKGVYVQSGQSLQFVQIVTEKTVNGYAICKTDLSDSERSRLVTDRTIQLYDRVVVEGTDLYDGKPI